MHSFIKNLGLRTKLGVLGLLALLAAAIPAAWLVADKQRVVAQMDVQASGVVPIQSALRVVQLTQKHRGLSAGVLSGNTALIDEHKTTREALDAATRALGEHAATASPEVARLAEQISAQWAALAQAVQARQIAPAESFTRHTALVAIQLDFVDELVDVYGLAIIDEAGLAHVVSSVLRSQPYMVEALGQMRAKGTAALTARQLSADDRAVVTALLDRAMRAEEGYTKDLRKATLMVPNFEALGSRLPEAASAVRAATGLVTKEVLRSEALSLDPKTYFAEMTRAIDTQFAMSKDGLDLLAQTLNERAAAARHRMLVAAGGLLALLAAAASLGWIGTNRALSGLADATAAAKALASGNLAVTLHWASDDEIGQLQQMMAKMAASLREVVQRVQSGAQSVDTACNEIAKGTHDLAARTEQQAGGLQQTAASMEQVTSAVKSNADNAREASEVSNVARTAAQRGAVVMKDAADTMEQVAASSKRIADIVAVIDGIAFQTNILALNAAVEAARAGEHGRGFAVVASEVRALSQRSATAAKEIKALIEASVASVISGEDLVKQAHDAMADIQQQVERVTVLMSDVATATREQSSGLAQVSESVSELDKVTQENAALVQENTAATDSLKQQADDLTQAVAMFRLAPQGRVAPA
jgi:methyl-accepting chemotaxis protein